MRLGKRSYGPSGDGTNSSSSGGGGGKTSNNKSSQQSHGSNNNKRQKRNTKNGSTAQTDDINDTNQYVYGTDGNTIQSVGQAKSISCDLIGSIFTPKIETLMIQRLEQYASDMADSEQQKHQYQHNSSTDIDKGTDTPVKVTELPKRPLLFYSEHSLQEFRQEVLIDTSNYFFGIETKTKKKKNRRQQRSDDDDNYNSNSYPGWKVRLNAAKFERLLDERYGILRPLVTRYPQIDSLLRSLQRKYMTGYFSPFRQNQLPISKSNSIILLFMIHRGSGVKLPWYATVLLTLFFVIGLQPWALVLIIILFHSIVRRITNRRVATMKKTIPLTQPYYHYHQHSSSSSLLQQQRNDTDTVIERNFNGTAVTVSKRIQAKYDLLNQPVGTPLLLQQTNNTLSSTIDMSLYDTILIGYGPGTLYTAALLSRAGRKVLVLSTRHDASGCISTTTLSSSSSNSTITASIQKKFNTNPKKSKKKDTTTKTTIDTINTIESIPFDIDNCTITKIQRQQQLLAPALVSNNGDYQGGIRFAQIGTKLDGYTYEIISIPTPTTTQTSTSSSSTENSTSDATSTPLDSNELETNVSKTSSSSVSTSFPPIVLCANRGLSILMEQTATYYGDSFPYEYDDTITTTTTTTSTTASIGQSLTGAYVRACDVINESSSAYYMSRIIADVDSTALTALLGMKNTTKSKKTKSKPVPATTTTTTDNSTGQYEKSAKIPASGLLYTVFENNPSLRVAMAAIGMKYENISPFHCSLGSHITNICSTVGAQNDGMYYPIGGPRALCHAFATVIEQNGGTVITSVPLSELLFDVDDNDDSTTVPKTTTTKTTGDGMTDEDNTIDDDIPKPNCIGVKLQGGQEIKFDKKRFSTTSTYNTTTNPPPIVITTTGFLNTYIRLFPDEIRTKYHVPHGIPALSERRPVFHILYVFAGTANELDVLGGADYYRVPAAIEVAQDYPKHEQQVQQQQQPPPLSTLQEGHDPSTIPTGTESGTTNDETSKSTTGRVSAKNRHQQKQHQPSIFTVGKSWVHISFPSAKDPSFEIRYGAMTTCIVTVEADDRFVTEFDTTHPKLFVIKQDSADHTNTSRLVETVTDDLIEVYPQLKTTSLLACDISGPHYKGLKHTPERYAAPGVTSQPYYPNLYVGGTDLTIDTTSGSFVSGWMVANSVQQYQPIDYWFLQKNITTDIERFLQTVPNQQHIMTNDCDDFDYDDVAVPLPPTVESEIEELEPVQHDDDNQRQVHQVSENSIDDQEEVVLGTVKKEQ